MRAVAWVLPCRVVVPHEWTPLLLRRQNWLVLTANAGKGTRLSRCLWVSEPNPSVRQKSCKPSSTTRVWEAAAWETLKA